MSEMIKEEENVRTDMQRLKMDEGIEVYYPLYRTLSLSIDEGQYHRQQNTTYREPRNKAVKMIKQ
jgi:hypothetical protein